MLNWIGLHQPAEWHLSRFRGAAQATVSAARLRRLASSSVEDGGADEEFFDCRDGGVKEGVKEAKELAKHRLGSSHLEEVTQLTTLLQSVDATLLDRSLGSVNELSGKGIAAVTLCSTMAFHVLRLVIREVFFDALMPSVGNKTAVFTKKRITEIYLLSTLHSLTCATFSLGKILSGRWDSPTGSQAMLCFSLGYTSYSLLTLRHHLIADPMFALNELANLVKMFFCLRSRGVRWVVPSLFCSEVPLACLSVLRMMAELGARPTSWSFRLALGAFTTSFAAIKGVLLPAAFMNLVVRRAKDYPELHQPNMLPAKLAVILRAFLNYAWLSAVAKHWLPGRRTGVRAPNAEQIEHLPRLSELTSSMHGARQMLNSACNPFSVLYFVILQSFYFVAPATLPAILFTFVKRPKYRLAASGSLLGLLLATFWPMKVDEPFHKKPLKFAPFDVSGRMMRSYLSFRSIYEEPLQQDRRYLLAIVPHGVMPFAMNCLVSELMEQQMLPNMVGASVLLKIPVLRQFARFCGMVPAKKATIRKALSWEYPHHVTLIIPGGIAEIFYMRPDIEQVVIKRRKGFVRLALESGVDLVPVYGLGHTHLFTTVDRSSRLGRVLMKLSRILRISLPLAVGRWGMPLIPYPRPVVALVGRPIRIDSPVPNPTQEQIDEVHGRFVEELRRIFDKHKNLVKGYENKRLYFEDEEVPGHRRDAVTGDYLFPSSLPTWSSKL